VALGLGTTAEATIKEAKATITAAIMTMTEMAVV
jgi:hypothetical protein